MNDELQNKLAAILGSLADQVQSATDATVAFGKEQLPLVAREVLTLAVVQCAMGIGLGFALLVAAVVWNKCMGAVEMRELTKYKEERKTNPSADDFFAFLAFCSRWSVLVVLVVAGIVVCCVNAHAIINPLVAPRVYLIEWCADRIK